MKRPFSFYLVVALVCLLMPAVTLAQAPDVASPMVSYQFFESLATAPAQPNIISPLVSYQNFEWPGDQLFTFQYSPNVSFYYHGDPAVVLQPLSQLATVGENITLNVQAVGANPLSYQWFWNGSPLVNSTNSNITLTNVQQNSSGSYFATVTNSYGQVQSSTANLIVYAGATTAPPPLQGQLATGQILSNVQGSKLANPTNDQLKWYNPGTGLFETAAENFLPGKMTIVLTHGWNSSPDAPNWPSQMAAALTTNYGSKVNIFAWDWRNTATSTLPGTAAGNTRAEGVNLGRALIATLGLGYNQPIHFIGHSFGTLVNCVAADYIHGDWRPVHDDTNVVFSPSNTHITLLDEAELIQSFKGLHVAIELLLATSGLGGSTADIEDAAQAVSLNAKVVPVHSAYVDNYVSEVGEVHSHILNTMLWRHDEIPIGYDFPLIGDLLGSGLHGYACEWYRQSILNPSGSEVGFFWSFERGTLGGQSQSTSYFIQSDDPTASSLAVVPADDAMSQILNSRGLIGNIEYNIVIYPDLQFYLNLSAVSNKIEGIYLDDLQYAGNLVAQYDQDFTPPATMPIYSNTAESTPAFMGSLSSNSTPEFQAHWGLNFALTPGIAQPQNVASGVKAFSTTVPGSNVKALNSSQLGDTADAVYTIVPIQVPLEAVGMSFEYKLNGAADDDFMTMGIGTENDYSMEAQYIDNNVWISSPVFPISDYRGQNVQFLFAMVGANGSPSGTLSIRNIQFCIPPRPTLTINISGSQAQLVWPLSGVDWTLQSTATLSDPSSWQSVALPTVDTEYQHTIGFDVVGGSQFFRLVK